MIKKIPFVIAILMVMSYFASNTDAQIPPPPTPPPHNRTETITGTGSDAISGITAIGKAQDDVLIQELALIANVTANGETIVGESVILYTGAVWDGTKFVCTIKVRYYIR